MPHLTTKVSNLKLYDSAGRVVLDTPVPEEQQTRYVLDGDRLVNRLRIPMSQTSAPEGDITDVAAVSIERMGRGDLANIDPKDRHIVFWVMSSLRFRFGCKGARTTFLLGPRSVCACKSMVLRLRRVLLLACAPECGLEPHNFERQNAIIPLSARGDAVTLWSMNGDVVSHHGVDLRPIVDPGCRCLAPSGSEYATPSIHFQVKLQNRNVWPHRMEFHDPQGRVVWSGILPRPNANIIGSWQSMTLLLAGRSNVWSVGPTEYGLDGTVPPFHNLTVVVQRKALTGVPSVSDLPSIRDVVVVGSAPTPSGAYLARVFPLPSPPLAASVGGTMLGDGTEIKAEWVDWATVLGDPMATPAEDEDAVLIMTAASAEGLIIGAVHLVDGSGAVAEVAVPQLAINHQTSQYAAGEASAEVLLTLNATFISADSFDWSSVEAIVPHIQGPPPSSPAEASALGTVVVSNVRIGVPQRVGHFSNPDDYNVDDLACDPLTGWFDIGNFVRHDPVRYSHCRECCCFFDDPGNPVVKHCYEQGDIIAQTTPAPDMAPNDQCAVCNRNNNPQVMSPRNTLLPPHSEPPYAFCDDNEPCTWNDRCRDDGACIADLYTTCLIKDFWGGDPSKDCEVCDGTGPNSTTLGCTARPGHYVCVCPRVRGLVNYVPDLAACTVVWVVAVCVGP